MFNVSLLNHRDETLKGICEFVRRQMGEIAFTRLGTRLAVLGILFMLFLPTRSEGSVCTATIALGGWRQSIKAMLNAAFAPGSPARRLSRNGVVGAIPTVDRDGSITWTFTRPEVVTPDHEFIDGAIPPNDGSGGGSAATGGADFLENNPPGIPPNHHDTCESIARGELHPERFARTTYFGKVMSAGMTRVLSAPRRLLTNPWSLGSDLLMLFVSPAIKQQFRNRMLEQGAKFSLHTVVTFFPGRALRNLIVSGMDASLASLTGFIETGNREKSIKHGANRLSSNVVSYVIIDSLTSGLDDHLILDRSLPALIRGLCTHFPHASFTSLATRGGIVLLYWGSGAAWETLHYVFIRGKVFRSQDVRKEDPNESPSSKPQENDQ